MGRKGFWLVRASLVGPIGTTMLHTHEVTGSSPVVSTKKKDHPTGGLFFLLEIRQRTRTHFNATVRWTVAATSSKTGGNYNVIESCCLHQQKQNICLPTNVLFLFIQAAGLAYHHDAVVDIISLFGAVYHHAPACIFLRLDDIQHFVLMICNSYGIDDIQGFALITLQNHGIIYYTNLNLTKRKTI